MRALVTGGSGFVGRHLVRRLKAGGAEVRSLDLAAPNRDADDVIEGSITDPVEAARACQDRDAVFHLAGNAELWLRDRSIFDAVNLGGVRTMLEAARRRGVKVFVQCSSLTTLVSRRAPIGPSRATETVEPPVDDMIGPYPRSKRAADLVAAEAARDGMDVRIAIPTEPLGAGDVNLTPPTRMMLDFLNGRTPAFIDCLLNFTPAESLADGFVAVAERGKPGERYLLGGENMSMERLLRLLHHLSGVPMPAMQLPYAAALAAGIVDTALADAIPGRSPKAPLTGVRLAGRRVAFFSDKAARELNWRAAPIKPALEQLLAWFESEGLWTRPKA